ncbi:MAG: hypothetical protein Q8920_07110 [Bacillota bacterium]|nr:hypothetical protein [Bacillota bacterium]
MVTISNKELESIEKSLSEALVKFSDGKIDSFQATQISKSAVKNIDFSNSALAHKGINWFAKKLIDRVDFSQLEVVCV